MNNKYFLILALIGISAAFALTSCTTNSSPHSEEEKMVVAQKPEDAIKRGEYLVAIMGCNDCHSPKRMGPKGPELIPELLLSGYPADRPVEKFTDPLIQAGFAMFYPDLTAAAGPWGISFAANLTPDETGIGNWTEEQFKKALQEGKSKGLDGGRMLLPPMPWANFTSMPDEDLHAIFSYLKSIQAVSNIVPQPIPPDQM